MSSVGGRLDPGNLPPSSSSIGNGNSNSSATAGYHLPTSLDFINRPNPIEPHAESQKHPLNGVSTHHREVVGSGGVGASGNGNAIGSAKSGAATSSTRASEHALNHILLPERDLHLGPSSSPAVGGHGEKSAALHHTHPHHQHQQQHSHHARRRKASTDISSLDLPKLPERRAQKRMRIPPTVAGLYQPPPESGILPRIDPGDASSRPPAARSATFPGLSATRKAIDAVVPLAPSAAESGPVATEQLAIRNVSGEMPPPAPSADNAGTTTDQPSSTEPGTARPSYWKPPLRRNMWTEEETGDLLKGVAKFGIGAWTKILKCPEYHFNRRTALDLKDRFRVTCPDDYVSRKSRGSKNAPTATAEDSGATSPVLPQQQQQPQQQQEETSAAAPDASPPTTSSRDPATPSCAPNKTRSTSMTGQQQQQQTNPSQRITPAKLSQLGISQPFTKTRRRARHGYTDAEDAAILKGYRKYNGSWASIRDDPELALSHRTATDLRDRMRNRYPEEYRKSGRLKISEKPSDASKRPKENVEGEKENRVRGGGAGAASSATASAAVSVATAHAQEFPQQHLPRHATARSNAVPMAPNASSSSLFPTRDVFFGAPFREQEDHDYDDADGDDAFPGGELITLDRDILNWATSTTTTTTAAGDADRNAAATTASLPSHPLGISTTLPITTASAGDTTVLAPLSATNLLGTGAVDPRETVLQNNNPNAPSSLGRAPPHPATGAPATRLPNFLAALPTSTATATMTTGGTHAAQPPPPLSSANSLPPLATLVRPGGALNGGSVGSFAAEDLELPSLMQW